MSGLSFFFTYILVIVFAHNLVFSGAAGVDGGWASPISYKKLLTESGLTSLFTLLAGLSILPFDYLFPISAISADVVVRGAVLTAFIIIWYLIISGVCKAVPALGSAVGERVPSAAFNGAVIGAPLLLFISNTTEPAKLIGCCLGAGLSLALATWLINSGLRRSDNPDIPAFMRGTPVMLVYIGLLSLAFSAFGSVF